LFFVCSNQIFFFSFFTINFFSIIFNLLVVIWNIDNLHLGWINLNS
jgi:hypothetical protein